MTLPPSDEQALRRGLPGERFDPEIPSFPTVSKAYHQNSNGSLRPAGTFTPAVFESGRLCVYDLDGFGVRTGRYPLPRFIGELLHDLRQSVIRLWGEPKTSKDSGRDFSSWKDSRRFDRQLPRYEPPVRLRHDRPPVFFEVRRLIPPELESGEYSPSQVGSFEPVVVLGPGDDPTRLPGWQPVKQEDMGGGVAIFGTAEATQQLCKLTTGKH